MKNKQTHDRSVQEFLRKCQRDDPQKFKEVMDKYPVLTINRMKTIQEREVSLSMLDDKE